MKRTLAIVVGLIVVYWLGSIVVYFFVSHETRVRWVLEECAAGFNETHKSRCIDGLALDYTDETSRFTRDQLGQMLTYLFLKEKHPDMNEFRYRVELPRDQIEIKVLEGSPETAEVSLVARFLKLQKGAFEPVWEVKIDGNMENASEGWKVKRTRYHGVSGKQPF